MIVLIPAYEPGSALIDLVTHLRRERPGDAVLVVDDGSGPAYAAVFAALGRLGALVVSHEVNQGKGRALKTGLTYARQLWPGADVVCADADGQHRVADIDAVARAVAAMPTPTLVLGARQFVGAVPLRSRFGNEATRRVFALATGLSLRDTQTGLRGIPATMVPWLLDVPGERFEWEQEVLLRCGAAGWPISEIPIATVYLAGNASSHFRPIRDSVRVLTPIARFAGTSLMAALLDDLLFVLLHTLGGSIVFSLLGARLMSASATYISNSRLVFGRSATSATSPRRFVALAVGLFGAHWAVLHALMVGLGWGAVPAKLTTDVVLFAVSYAVQRWFVFARPTVVPEGRAARVPVGSGQ